MFETLEFHEVANIFPLMTGEEFENLKDDIRKNGLIEPIWTYQGRIIDGRNRYKACLEVGVQPKIREWSGNGSLVSFVVSMNLHRRHLSSGQKATAAFDALPMYEAEARERQVAAGKQYGNHPTEQLTQKIEQAAKNDSTAVAVAARDFGTNRQYIADVKAISEKAPELVEEIRSGAISIPQAKREIRVNEYRQRVEEAAKDNENRIERDTRKPQLVLADPPWKYDFSETDNRKVENQYATATIDEIKNHLPETDENCVLFLWATAPKLQEALQLLDLWGFDYKTHAVWDKKKIGMGYWFRGRHEILIVATKGRVSPPLEDLRVSSVFEEERTDHSRKPECVYSWIEKTFPHLAKLEMYAREQRQGWSCYGNEVPRLY